MRRRALYVTRVKMCLFCEIQIFKIGDSTMFEEIKDYQGRELRADKILSLFPEKGGHDVVLS